MKKCICIILFLAVTLMFGGCVVMTVPDTDSIGESKTFTKDGITLLLTDRFTEQESSVGFYAYYSSDFCGVTVLKEEFTLEEGLADKSVEAYVRNVIDNNGHDVEPQNKDGLWYYFVDKGDRCIYSYSYKGSDAFWVVQFICNSSDATVLEDTFYLWAQAVEVA